MDQKGLKNIRGTLALIDEALGYHIDDANRVALQIRNSVDTDSSRDQLLRTAEENAAFLESVSSATKKAVAGLDLMLGTCRC